MRETLRPVGASGIHMLVLGVSSGVFALSLLLQGQRWRRSAAYHNLLVIMPAPAWGVLFGVVAVLLLTAAVVPRPLGLAYAAVLLAFLLVTCWDIAFIIRYLTNTATTPETLVSWAVFDYLLLRAGALINRERGTLGAGGA